MTAWMAFMKKEFTETIRNGKLLLLTILFLLFGIMNPAVAKLTPWLLGTVAGSMTDMGLNVGEVQVNALTSWAQFHKNVPMAMIVFLLVFSGIFTAEYQKGTLINVLTKGLQRWKVLASKAVVMTVLWSGGYWLCYGVTYGYNQYFWDNRQAHCLVFSAFCVYLFGLWMISLILLGSAFFQTNTAVLLIAGGGFAAAYLLSFIPALKEYMPSQLLFASGLLSGTGKTEEYLTAVKITVMLTIGNGAVSTLIFNRRAL